MKLNIAIVALALSSSAVTLAAPTPMAGGSGLGAIRKLGSLLGKGKKSAEQERSFYDSYYVPDDDFPEYRDATHPYVPGKKKAREAAEESSQHGYTVESPESSRESSPVHRSYGGGSQSARYPPMDLPPPAPQHGGGFGGAMVPYHPPPRPAEEPYIGMQKLGPSDDYYAGRNDHGAPAYVDYHPQNAQAPHSGGYGYPHPQPGYGHAPYPQYGGYPQPSYGHYPQYPQHGAGSSE